MDEQIDKGNQYTYDGRKDKQGQSIYRQWMKTDKGNKLPTMDKQTNKGNQYTYDGRTDRKGQSIYLRTLKGNQYAYDGGRQARAINIPTLE
jgi:CDP-glycerol glycerophosphotransferase (TagB/SpsB family)